MGKQANAKTPLFGEWQPGGALVFADQSFSTGKRWFVHSVTGSDTAGWGASPDKPVATIDYANDLCTACEHDVIYVMPGHAESLTGATSLVLDTDGVQVIGLGHGTLQPKLTLTTAAAATVNITGADVTFKNIHIFQAYTGGVTAGITIGADADGFTLEDLKMDETTAGEEFLIGISIAAGCTDGTIRRLRYYGTTAGTTSSAVAAAGAADRLLFEDNYIDVDASAATVKLDAAASTDLIIQRNVFIQRDTGAGLGIDCSDTATGFISDNRCACLKAGVEGVTGNLMCYGENYTSNLVNLQGFYLPVQDS